MLQPANRLTLIDAMRPPAGFGLESAMGVTFTLDLRALLAAPAAFVLARSEGLASDDLEQEPIELLHAIRAHAHKLTVFCQAGETALPPSARRVFAFLERSVVPVRAPRGGVVHPKVWVLRYEALESEAEDRLRVLIASRNLTFDGSWDTLLRLDQATGRRGADLAPIADIFDGLAHAAPYAIAEGHSDRVESLSGGLRNAVFALPPGIDALLAHAIGLERKPAPLPDTADRSLVLSPFVSDDFFSTVRPAPIDELVSRPEAIDRLAAESLTKVQVTSAFDDGSLRKPESEELTAEDPGRPLSGLHAKIFAFEQGDQAQLFLGSANATGAAFDSNVEVLIELRGSIESLGIDRLCEGTEDERGLRDLFISYSPRPEPEPEPDRALDGARRRVAQLQLTGHVEQSESGWAVTYRSVEPVPPVEDARIQCWPLASPGGPKRVASGEPLDVRFETSLEAISGFLAFEIGGDDGMLTRFVVPVPLEGVPEERERILLKSLLGNSERFLRYVLALLDPEVDLADALDAASRNGRTNAGAGLGDRLPVLERMLKSMRNDPARLKALQPLVNDLRADDALPPGFAALWDAVYEVATEGDR